MGNCLSLLLPLFLALAGEGVGDPQAAAKSTIASARIKPASFVARTANGERQVIFLEINSEGLKDARIRITKAEWQQPVELQLGGIAKGKQTAKVHVPVATQAGSVHATLEAEGERRDLPEVTMAVPRKWTVYLAEHTHTDIGYTRPQTEILPEHLRYIDYALDFCDLTDAYPDDARFRWTCEVSWAVREYLKRRPPEQVARLRKRVAEGRIELMGMFLNMSEIADENSLAASLQPLRAIESVFGKAVRSAMQNDVNGAAWCLPDYYSGIGVRYLIMGINKTRSLLPFDQPTLFWWESPSGKRLLAFRADHYMTGNFWKIHEGRVAGTEPGLADYLNNLEKVKYPFDRIGVQFSGYSTDNSPPARKECDLVKDWNEAYVWPRLRIATAGEFPAYIEKNHATELKTHRQGWPDWWTDGFGSAARETAASRETHSAMQINEALLAMASVLGARPDEGWIERSAAVQEALLFYDEHTFGAAESISDPLVENSMVQWGEKASYAWEAVKGAAMLREEAFGLLQRFIPRSGVPSIAVFNTLGHSRSGLIRAFIDHEMLPEDRRFRIVDPAGGGEIPAQRLNSRSEGAYWAIWAKDVPALGFKTYRIEVSPETVRQPAAGKDAPSILENRFYRLDVDPQIGAVKSLKDMETGRELVDAGAPWQLGQFIYERTKNRNEFNKPAFSEKNPFQRTSLRAVQVTKGADGPIWKSLKLQAEADGCASPGGVQLEIRLYETEKRIEFHYAIRKTAITSPEAVYVAFPFSMPGGKIVYEGQGGTVTPGEGQLPGSASDWQTIQSFVAMRGGNEQIILGCNEAPLVQLGDVNLGKWMPVTRIDKPHIYSWVMNNYWFTNFRASQHGEFRWSYYLTSSRGTDNSRAMTFGWDSRIPLVTRVLTPGTSESTMSSSSAVEMGAANLALIGARPAREGNGIILHLRETDGKTAIAAPKTSLPGMKLVIAGEVNVLEAPLTGESVQITFAPFEAKFLRLTFKR